MAGRRAYGDPSNGVVPSAQDAGTADVNVVADQMGALARSLQSHRDAEEMLDGLSVVGGPADPWR